MKFGYEPDFQISVKIRHQDHQIWMGNSKPKRNPKNHKSKPKKYAKNHEIQNPIFFGISKFKIQSNKLKRDFF